MNISQLFLMLGERPVSKFGIQDTRALLASAARPLKIIAVLTLPITSAALAQD